MPNAKSGKDSVDMSILGMEGIPREKIEQRLFERLKLKRKKNDYNVFVFPDTLIQTLTINANYQGGNNPILNPKHFQNM